MPSLTINPSRTPRTRRAGDAPLVRFGKLNGTATRQHMYQIGAAELFRASFPGGPHRSDCWVGVWREEWCPDEHEHKTARCPGTARADRTVIGVVDDLPGRVEDLPRRPG